MPFICWTRSNRAALCLPVTADMRTLSDSRCLLRGWRELRAHLDAYARTRLTLADFDPVLHYDSELALGDITPEMFQLLSRLEPFGMGNPEPVFRGERMSG